MNSRSFSTVSEMREETETEREGKLLVDVPLAEGIQVREKSTSVSPVCLMLCVFPNLDEQLVS